MANKILYISACVRKDSRTEQLSRELLNALNGEISEINLYSQKISPVDSDMLKKRDLHDYSGEEFKIAGSPIIKYRFTNDQLKAQYTVDDGWETSMALINKLGDVEVIKLPFEPKKGEIFWTYWTNWSVTDFEWEDKKANFDFRKFCGCVFRTKEEALAARPEKFKELTGREWQEEE